jgi:phage shock protein A
MLSRYIDMLVDIGSSNLPREYREKTLKALVAEYNRQYAIEVCKPIANAEKEAENYKMLYEERGQYIHVLEKRICRLKIKIVSLRECIKGLIQSQ